MVRPGGSRSRRCVRGAGRLGLKICDCEQRQTEGQQPKRAKLPRRISNLFHNLFQAGVKRHVAFCLCYFRLIRRGVVFGKSTYFAVFPYLDGPTPIPYGRSLFFSK